MIFQEMGFDFSKILKSDGFSSLWCFDGVIHALRALLVLPLLNDRLFAHHANTRRVNIEWHIGKTLTVDFAKFGLVVVVVGWPDKHIAHPTLGNIRKGPLRWLHSDGLRRVKDRDLASQCVS